MVPWWKSLENATSRSPMLEEEAALYGKARIHERCFELADVLDVSYKEGEPQLTMPDVHTIHTKLRKRPGLCYVYVRPSENRVVRWTPNARRLAFRALSNPAFAQPIFTGCTTLVTEYVRGIHPKNWMQVEKFYHEASLAGRRVDSRIVIKRMFDSTVQRLAMYRPKLLDRVVAWSGWQRLCEQPCTVSNQWHGDMTQDNLIITPDGVCVGIDWSADTKGPIEYDIAKLINSAIYPRSPHLAFDLDSIPELLMNWDWVTLTVIRMCGSHLNNTHRELVQWMNFALQNGPMGWSPEL